MTPTLWIVLIIGVPVAYKAGQTFADWAIEYWRKRGR